MSKKGKILVLVLVLVMVASLLLFVACNKSKPVEKSARDFVSMDVRPNYGVPVILTGTTDKEKIFELYSIALDNLRDTPYLVAYNEGFFENTTAGMTNYLYDDYIIMKTPNEYFYCNYRSIKDCPIAESAIFADMFKEMGAILSERRYYEKNKDHAIWQMTHDNYMNENSLPTANWDSLEIQNMDPIVFNAADAPEDFVINEHDILQEYLIDDYEYEISFEEVTDDPAGKYYKMTFGLDPEKATKKSEIKIKDQTGDSNTSYYRIVYQITIWDNGYFRSYDNDSYFSGKALGLFKADYKDEYHWHFSYDEQDCDIANYVDAKGIYNAY